MRFRAATSKTAAFTLIEVLAALLFMAIVIPVAVEALHVASVSGEVAVRKADAMRIADQVLNQSIATTNWNQYTSGTLTQSGREYRWTLRNGLWTANPNLDLVTAEVSFSVQGHDYAVRLNTLENPLNTTTSSRQ